MAHPATPLRSKRASAFALALCLGVAARAWAVPLVGHGVPAFMVEDLTGAAHTQRDLAGRWTVVFAMTDKDSGPALTAWYRRVSQGAPVGSRLLTFAALDLFGLIPTATITSEARGATPRNRWGEVWLSRNGSLATALGLPESEVPFVFVVDPAGRVAASEHCALDDASFARVMAALSRGRPAPARP